MKLLLHHRLKSLRKTLCTVWLSRSCLVHLRTQLGFVSEPATKHVLCCGQESPAVDAKFAAERGLGLRPRLRPRLYPPRTRSSLRLGSHCSKPVATGKATVDNGKANATSIPTKLLQPCGAQVSVWGTCPRLVLSAKFGWNGQKLRPPSNVNSKI